MTDPTEPAWWRCTRSDDPRFTKGTAYEVFRYDEAGRAIIVTNDLKSATLPVPRASFVPYDPWARAAS